MNQQADRLRYSLKMRGLKQVDLVEKTGISQSAISQYLSGKVKPKQDKIYLMAKALNVSELWLMCYDNTLKVDKYSVHSYSYFGSSCAAGVPVTTEAAKELPQLPVPDIFLSRHAGNNSIVFMHANGESMNKVFPDGALLAVLPMDLIDLKNGEIVVFEDENHGLSVKRYYRHDSTIIFKPDSTNDVYYDLIYKADENKIRIIGKVVSYVVTL